MPPPAPSAPSLRTVYDIVKSHIQLPINRDYNALKFVLRDWMAYTTHTPLQEKPTFAAELVITITRTSPTSLGTVTQGTGGISGTAVGKARSARREGRWWASWGTRESYEGAGGPSLAAKVSGAASSSAPTIPPYVYRKIVPLHVWTAVLPWEMQRGLSFSDLRLPPNVLSARGTESGASASPGKIVADEVAQDSSGTEAAAVADPRARSGIPMQPPQQRQQGTVVDAEEEDPYGVVTSPITFLEGNSASAAAALAGSPLGTPAIATAAAAATSSFSTTPAVPAMLFLSDMRSTKAHGIGFWSGAIRQAIDVLFVGPTLPSAVNGASASFRHLRQQDGLALVMENKISSEMLHRFFPLHEIGSPSASSATFRVHSFGHLDPLPSSLHPSRLGVDDRQEEYRGLSFTVTPDAPYNLEEAPRYVFEVPRHTLRPAVAAALKESCSAYQQQLRTSAAGGRAYGKVVTPIHNFDVAGSKQFGQVEDDVSIDLVVNLSEQLRADLYAKAKLCVEYVSLLEEAIAHYARKLNTGASAAAEVPLDDMSCTHGGAGAEAGADNGKRVKVWLSEHEFRWMTPAELKQASKNEAATVRQANESSSVHADEEDVFQESCEEAASMTQMEDDGVAVVDAVAQATPRDAATSAVAAQPAQPGAVSAAHSISLQSPILQDEEEARPSYLAPSFVGRHEAPALQGSAVVLSADKLARYPRTHSHMQELPPVDYELYELCMRLGVGQQSVLYHYHERILQEWRRELHRLRQLRNTRGAPDPPHIAAPSHLSKEDVQRMVGLVRDRSLQLPSDMVSLVEAVAAAM